MRRGRDHRKSISNKFKARVIMEVEAGEKQSDVTDKFNIHKSQVSVWLKNKSKITRAAIAETKLMFKVQSAKKYNELYKGLRKNFLTAREQGHQVDFNRQ